MTGRRHRPPEHITFRRYLMNHHPIIPGLDLLETSHYGAYAVDLTQTIRYWNTGAERITGHRRQDIIGRNCYQALQNLPADRETPVCQHGCPSLRATQENRIPPVYEVRMLCASGLRKLVSITPLIIAASEIDNTTLVHLFHESRDQTEIERVTQAMQQTLSAPPRTVDAGNHGGDHLTDREMEVLRLTALGLTPHQTASELHISYHTVRNHIANLRRKLQTSNKLDLVRKARNLGLV